MRKGDVLSLLSDGIVEVHFTKVDGTTRVMMATLDSDIVVNGNADEAKSEMRMNSTAQPVWDVEANGWRAFKWNSITSVNKILTPNGVS